MGIENFKSFTTEEFVHDEYFREIVRESGSTNRLNQLLEDLPEKQHEINVAIQIISGLDVKKRVVAAYSSDSQEESQIPLF
jgi:hypothetical protein